MLDINGVRLGLVGEGQTKGITKVLKCEGTSMSRSIRDSSETAEDGGGAVPVGTS